MKVLCANAQTMSHGINLTIASTIVWFAPPYSHETYVQANARIVRPGQKNVTNIINLTATKEERRIAEGLQTKARFLDIVLDIMKEQK